VSITPAVLRTPERTPDATGAAAAADPIAAWLAQRPPLSRAQKFERLAFTFCKMGTVGLVAWLVTPPLFVLGVALAAIGLYGRALALGIRRTQCILRRPLLVMGFWSAVAAADLWVLLIR
jgi:hypothetical protein